MAAWDDEQTGRLRVQPDRRMTPQERISVAAEMFEWGVAMVQDCIRHQHPSNLWGRPRFTHDADLVVTLRLSKLDWLGSPQSCTGNCKMHWGC